MANFEIQRPAFEIGDATASVTISERQLD